MGFYAQQIVPWLIHLGMGKQDIAAMRQRMIPGARGRVLEIGIGSGHNLPFYTSEETAVSGLEPSPKLLAMARKAAARVVTTVELVDENAEAMPFEDRSFDTVVSTWTLCSIPDWTAALGEMRRVLKPDGTLVFIEHGRAPDPRVALWQNRLNGLWGRIAGGCNMNRPIDSTIREAGFDIAELETGYLFKGPRVLTYSFAGRATRR